MIKKSLMAVILFCYSINAISQTDISSCDFFANSQSINLTNNFNLCDTENVHRSTEELIPTSSQTGDDKGFPFPLKKNKSPLAAHIAVILFIPGLIILLLARSTKSAK